MRVFVGIYLPVELQEYILRFQKSHSELDVRWVPRENLHITLVPPWKVETPEEVVSALQTVAVPSGIVLHFREIVFGPSEPRLIWTTAVSGVEELTDFRNTLLQVLHRTPEKRTFLPHITIAKVRISDLPKFRDSKLHEPISWKFTVKTFSLIQSHLTPTGAAYKEIKTFNL